MTQVEALVDDIENLKQINQVKSSKGLNASSVSWSSEMQKRSDNLFQDLHRLFTRNQDKILPLKTLVRCIQLMPSVSSNEESQQQDIFTVNE